MSATRYMRASKMSEFRSDAPLTDDQIWRYAPSVMADHAHESRSQRYAFIQTREVLDGLRREGFLPFEVRQTRVRNEDKRDFTKHLIRFRHPDAVSNTKGEVPEIILLNSHDGSSAYKMMSGYFRFICSNGLIFGDMQHDIKIPHSGKVIDNVIEGAFRVIDDIKLVNQSVETFKSERLEEDEQLVFASAAHLLRWEDQERAPVEPTQLLKVRRFEDRRDDLWTTFNRVQENIMRGGLNGMTDSHRRTTTRAVAGVNENVKLNRALWQLADGMARLKRGESVEQILAHTA